MKLSDYDPDLDDLADLAGHFKASQYEDIENWKRRQWSRVADALGFREALDRQLHQTPERRRLVDSDSLRVFGRWFETRVQPQREPGQARVRHICLNALRRSYPTNLWLPEIDSERLPESACFTPSDLTGASPVPRNPFERVLMRSMAPAVQPRRRAFRSDVTASFFHDRDSRRPMGCNYRVKLALGTFPYVYGRNLGNEAPGLFWASVRSPGNGGRPAFEAMRIAASMWTPQGNLAQDARIVVAHYQRFRKFTSHAIDTAMPGARDPRTGLIRRGLQPLVDTRGTISPKGYNLTLRAFAAFFAARRAYLNASSSFNSSAKVRNALRANPDPILRRQLRAA